MDINEGLSAGQTRNAGLVSNKVARFSHTATAYTEDDVNGVSVYNYTAAQNIPLASSTNLNAVVLDKGVRAQASSLPRNAINHFFGRVSYNLNKVVDMLSSLFTLLIRSIAQNNSYYSPTASYLVDDVCFYKTLDEFGYTRTQSFIRVSVSPTGLVGIPPIDADGNVVGTHWALVSRDTNVLHGVFERTVGAGNPLPSVITTTTFTLRALATNVIYYFRGKKVTVKTNKTCTVSAAGLYYVYFISDTGAIEASTDSPGFTTTSNVIIATILWNGSDYGLVSDERHSYNRNKPWHVWAHKNIGPMYTSGLGLTASGTGAAATFSVASGEISDEDILFAIGTQTTCRQFWQNGASTETWDKVARTTPFKLGAGNRPCYVRSDTFALVEMSASPARYINAFLYATTDIGTPISMLVETISPSLASSNGYSDAASARAAPWPNLANLGVKREVKAVWRVVISSSGVIQTSVATDDVRQASSIPVGSVGASVVATGVSFNPSGTLLDTNVQSALDRLGNREYDLVIDSDAKLLLWQTSGTWERVLIKKGTWTLPPGGYGIDLTVRGTNIVVGQPGSAIVFSEGGFQYATVSGPDTVNPVRSMHGVTCVSLSTLGPLFANCENLYNCVAKRSTGGVGFIGCYNLTDCNTFITTSSTTVATVIAFLYCVNLTGCSTSFTHSGTDSIASGVQVMGFQGCSYLSLCSVFSATIRLLNTSTLYGFISCSSLSGSRVSVLSPITTGVYVGCYFGTLITSSSISCYTSSAIGEDFFACSNITGSTGKFRECTDQQGCKGVGSTGHIKNLTGTFPVTAGTSVSITHGLASVSKIESIEVSVYTSSNSIYPAGYTVSALAQFSFVVTPTAVIVYSQSASSIYGQAIKIIIAYTE